MIDLAAQLETARLVPVVVIDHASHAAPLAEALTSAGLPTVEVTLRTAAALDALRVMAEQPDLIVGAGTVVRREQVGAAVAAGAQYIVSPGFSVAVVRECADHGVPCVPGVATATEILRAVDRGIDLVKFFPAEAAGGVAAVRALSAPFPQVRFVPTGGITARTLPEYLAVASVVAVGGSWMVAPELVAARDFGRIAELSREAAAVAGHARKAATS